MFHKYAKWNVGFYKYCIWLKLVYDTHKMVDEIGKAKASVDAKSITDSTIEQYLRLRQTMLHCLIDLTFVIKK